jgi:hypothetical protein
MAGRVILKSSLGTLGLLSAHAFNHAKLTKCPRNVRCPGVTKAEVGSKL